MDTRPPPPQGSPYFVNRFYKRSLRPICGIVASLTAIWSIFAAIGFYRNIGPFNDNGAPKLATISIIIGSIYMGVFVIGLFGCIAPATQKLKLVRIFAYLSALAVLMVSGVNLLRVITHFTMRGTILKTCSNDATGQIYVYGGWWGPVYSDPLSRDEAQRFCTRAYDRDSWSLVVGLLLLTALGIFFSIIAFGYLRQLLDPSSPANNMRFPHRQAYPGPFADPPDVAYNHYPPPPGPPPVSAPYSQSGPEYAPPTYEGGHWTGTDPAKKDPNDDRRYGY